MKEYSYFQELLTAWFQGTKTKQEIIVETKGVLDIEKHQTEFSFFMYAVDMSLHEYNQDYAIWWQTDQEDEGYVAPTIKGLVHNIIQYLAGDITEKDFLEWATFYNTSNGYGQFENHSIEYYCLIFLPHFFEQLEPTFFKSSIPLIEKSTELSYAEFVIALYLQLPKEKKSFYYFLKSYLENKKTDEELNQYLVKKFQINIADQEIILDTFPYYTELQKHKNQNLSIDDFMTLMEERTKK